MDWNAVADALEAAANTVPGINAYSEVPDDLANIGFYVGEIDVDFDVTFRRRPVTPGRTGTDEAIITCRVLVARFDDKAAQRKLRTFMSGTGPTALVQALSADKTLGGTVDSSQVKSMKGNRLFVVGESKFYGVELDIFVIGDA
jgi:hypothetical protein